MIKITAKSIETFGEYLKNEEKSEITIEKYIHDVVVFMNWLC